ncbi:biotin/lipoyl-containing protein [Methylobacterium sp. A49B]
MADVQGAEELWSTALLPEGVLERWFVADGARVRAGETVAAVRIGAALHDIASPAGGRLTVLAPVDGLVDPGRIIAEVNA